MSSYNRGTAAYIIFLFQLDTFSNWPLKDIHLAKRSHHLAKDNGVVSVKSEYPMIMPYTSFNNDCHGCGSP